MIAKLLTQKIIAILADMALEQDFIDDRDENADTNKLLNGTSKAALHLGCEKCITRRAKVQS
jgi:hypothetical protein